MRLSLTLLTVLLVNLFSIVGYGENASNDTWLECINKLDIPADACRWEPEGTCTNLDINIIRNAACSTPYPSCHQASLMFYQTGDNSFMQACALGLKLRQELANGD